MNTFFFFFSWIVYIILSIHKKASIIFSWILYGISWFLFIMQEKFLIKKEKEKDESMITLLILMFVASYIYMATVISRFNKIWNSTLVIWLPFFLKILFILSVDKLRLESRVTDCTDFGQLMKLELLFLVHGKFSRKVRRN